MSLQVLVGVFNLKHESRKYKGYIRSLIDVTRSEWRTKNEWQIQANQLSNHTKAVGRSSHTASSKKSNLGNDKFISLTHFLDSLGRILVHVLFPSTIVQASGLESCQEGPIIQTNAQASESDGRGGHYHTSQRTGQLVGLPRGCYHTNQSI